MNRHSLFPALQTRLRGDVVADEPLARHTSLRVGGTVDVLAAPADLDDLRELLRLLAQHDIAYFLIGGGYNLLIRDGGFRGVAISLRRLSGLRLAAGGRIIAGAGAMNGTLVRFAQEQHLGGAEFLIGIPGTIGGALSMNAGAHGEAVLDRLETLTTLHEDHLRIKKKKDLRFGYRHLELPSSEVIVEATFLLKESDPVEIEERIDRFLAHRRTTQRVSHPNAGSFFKNPEGKQSWRLIEQAGLRGCRIGGAQVSDVHANFLVNVGGATARDFLELAVLVKKKVQEVSGILLEEEVRIVGEE